MHCSSYRRLPLHWDCHRVGACTQLRQRNWWACMQDGQEEVGDFRKWLVTFAEHWSLWRLQLWERFLQCLADKGLLRHISLTKIEQQASQTAIVNEENTHEARLSLHLFSHINCWLIWYRVFQLVCQWRFPNTDVAVGATLSTSNGQSLYFSKYVLRYRAVLTLCLRVLPFKHLVCAVWLDVRQD